MKYPPGTMPVKDSDVRKFRVIDESGKKSLYEQMPTINEEGNYDMMAHIKKNE